MAFISSTRSAAGQAPVAPAAAPEVGDDTAALARQLDDADASVRRWAARDLQFHAGASAVLAARLACEEEVAVRDVILTSLTRRGDSDAVAALVAALRSEEAARRNEAIEAMKALPEEVAPVMGALLADADSDVRIMAVNVLESLRHPQVEAWLIGVIEHDAVVNVCGAAVDLLGEVGTQASRAPLERLLARFADEPYIVFAAGLAQQRIGKE
ncbi:HEAT repeat domain-containing protein [Massilia sp. PWRC2]|uniref:HEAT repeat domain-containing protein n=1 Tax=Massilia sp. PWRC2 TaxID=2804626 RepID=UPI003CF7C65F